MCEKLTLCGYETWTKNAIKIKKKIRNVRSAKLSKNT